MDPRPASSRVPLPGLLVLIAAAVALYWDAIRSPFLNDDFMFLEQAQRTPFLASLAAPGALGNYYRPLSRQVYFAVVGPLAHGHPLGFHVVNALLFLVAVMLVADLLGALLPVAGVLAGTAYFAWLPLQHVNLMWVSCSQDLMALAGVLGAFAFHRRGRTLPALLCFAAACASKETALALPLGLAAWQRFVPQPGAPRDARSIARGVAPYAVLACAWAGVAIAMRARSAAPAPLDLSLTAFAAGIVHMFQSLLGLEHPQGIAASLATHAPAVLPLVILAGVAWWLPARVPPARGSGLCTDAAGAPGTAVAARSAGGSVPAAPVTAVATRLVAPPRTALLAFAACWAVAFALPAGPVSYGWSSYYYTLAAVGGALAFGVMLARADRWAWLMLAAGLGWWHAGSTASPAFATVERPWVWTSHLTPFYFQRAAALTDSLSRQLRRVVPHPAPHTRMFFATLPSWAGFQMGNGAQVRAIYRDSTLESYFYSRFSDSTADAAPCRFLFWDGRELVPLYASMSNPWFQVGSDLVLLGRFAGASHAFRRGLDTGGDRMDLMYWLGWSELMSGDRGLAENTWTAFGAHDDSLIWSAHLRAAHNAVVDGDTLNARRHLITAIEYGIGRPAAHAVLGELMQHDPRPFAYKYALMELEVAAWLDPHDWEARKNLVLGLATVRLEERARQELESLVREVPAMARDPELARASARLLRPAGPVVESTGGRR